MMAKSMTGFAYAEGRYGENFIAWRLKSVNHRFLDLSLRVPEGNEALESVVAERLRCCFSRGRLEGHLAVTLGPAGGAGLALDVAMLEGLLALEAEVARRGDGDGEGQGDGEGRGRLSMHQLLSWPGMVRQSRPIENEDKGVDGPFFRAVMTLFEQVVAELAAVRAREGAALTGVMVRLLAEFEQGVAQVVGRLPEVRQRTEARLRQRMASMMEDAPVEAWRLAQELTFLLNRMDIAEELDRMAVHLGEMKALLEKPTPIGRRFDFLCQELNRESNTLCSKAQDGEIARIGVDMKVLVEKMREQVQNLE